MREKSAARVWSYPNLLQWLALPVALMSVPLSARAQTWTGSSDTNWHNSGNWSGGIPNSNTPLTTIAVGTAVILQPAATGAHLEINGGDLLIQGPGTGWSGSLTSGHVNIAQTAGKTGSVILREGASWQTNDDLGIGINGTGELTLTGNSSLAVGNFGIFIGYNQGSTGTLNIGSRVSLETGGTLTTAGVHFGNGTGVISFNQSNTFTLSSPMYGSGSLVQRGQGGKTIITADNTGFTGTTTIDRGTLQVGTGGATGFLPGPIINNGSLVIDRSGTTTYVAGISGAGSLTKQGTGTLILSGAKSYTGATTISAGQLVLAATASSSFSIASGAIAEFSVPAAAAHTVNTTFTGAGTLRKSEAGSLAWTTGKATFALGSGSSIDVQAGTFVGGSHGNEDWTANFSDLMVGPGATFEGVEAHVRVDALGGWGTITSGYNGDGSITFGVDHGGDDFKGVLANGFNGSPGHYIKAGKGWQTLSGNNTFTGGLTIHDGILQIGAGGTTGSVVSNIINNGELIFFRSDDVTYGSMLTGNGTLIKKGPETLILTNGKGGIGGARVLGGTLQIGAGGASGSLTGNVELSGVATTLAFDRSDFLSYDGEIMGSGKVTVRTSAAVYFNGDHTYTGGTTVQSGTLVLVGSINGNVLLEGPNSYLQFNRSADHTFNGVISGAGAVFVNGGVVTTLTGTNTYGGYTQVVGHLQLGSSGTVLPDTTNVTVTGGAVLALGASLETIRGLSFTGAGTIAFDIAGLASYEKLKINEASALDGTLRLSLLGGYEPELGATFDLFDWGTSVNGTFSTLDLPGLGEDLLWDTSNLYTDGTLSVVAIPEPSAIGLLIFGGCLLAGVRRRETGAVL